MTVRTYWNQIVFSIDDIFMPHLTNRRDVVHMDVAFTHTTIYFSKIETANNTDMSVFIQTYLTSSRITLIAVYLYFFFGTLIQSVYICRFGKDAIVINQIVQNIILAASFFETQ